MISVVFSLLLCSAFAPIRTESYKDPFEEDDFQKFWNHISNCASKVDPVKVPIPISLGYILELLNLEYYKGKLNFTNVELSGFSRPFTTTGSFQELSDSSIIGTNEFKNLAGKKSDAKINFDFTLPLKFESDFDCEGTLLWLIPLVGEGRFIMQLGLRANGSITYDDSNDQIFMKDMDFLLKFHPYVNITGMINGNVDLGLSRQAEVLLDYAFNYILKEVVVGLTGGQLNGIEDVIMGGLQLLFLSFKTSDIFELFELCDLISP